MGVSEGARRNHLNMQEAFAAYERVRHRLPSVARNAACRRLPNLDAIADEIDVFLLDAFGVLNIGETAITGVPEQVARLQRAGKRVMVVSNAAGSPHADLIAKYKRLGYDFAPQDIITSRKTTLHRLNSEPTRRWGLMAKKSLGRADLEHLDVTYLGCDAYTYDASEAFLLLGSADWTEEQQVMLEQSLGRESRPVYVGNPDIVAPREYGFSTEPGCFAHRLADATGVTPNFFGKPFGNIFDLVFSRLGDHDAMRTVMVGDSLHTDILGGQAAGIKTALVARYGFFAGYELDGPISASGIQPDYILERP